MEIVHHKLKPEAQRKPDTLCPRCHGGTLRHDYEDVEPYCLYCGYTDYRYRDTKANEQGPRPKSNLRDQTEISLASPKKVTKDEHGQFIIHETRFGFKLRVAYHK